jgi:hypothetical protein
MEKKNELIKVVETSGLETQTASSLKERFLPFFEQAQEWRRKAGLLIVTDESQVKEMKLAREARLELKKIRVEADKTRKALKEDSLRYGKAVQGVYNVIEYLISPIEKHLEEQEKFVEIREQNRKEAVRQLRESELESYMEFVPYGMDLGGMSDEDYSKLLNGAKIQLQAKIDAEKKEEEDRLLKEKADAEERARIKKENEELRERIAKEQAIAEEERRKAKEIEDRIALEAQAKKQAEEKAKAAPDKIKLIELSNTFDNFELPVVNSEEAKLIIQNVRGLLSKVSGYIHEKSSKL